MSMVAVSEQETTLRRGPKRKYDPIEVVQSLADGFSIGVLAQKYDVSTGTIRVNLHMLVRHYQVKNTVQLVAHFLRNGWID